MTDPAPMYATLDDWVARTAIPFALDAPAAFNAAVATLATALGNSVELLGLGEALHGGEDVLLLRNRLFQQLVAAHGYSAIALESSMPRSRLVNDYVAGRGPASYAAVRDAGFSHGFGQLTANQELVEWMRHYNATASPRVPLQFYGFDSPTEMMGSDSPRQVLYVVLDYLTAIDDALGQEYRQCIDPLLGDDSAWANPAAMMDPTQSIGRSANASALRIETEELLADLRIRRPELVASSDEARYAEALHSATVATQLLTYHAGVARASSDRTARLLGLRDAMMADNLAYLVARERGRGHVLAFAHNSHLRRGKAEWQLGADLYHWWPAGAHLHVLLGPRYAVIGSAVGESPANGIATPEAGTLESRLTAVPGPIRLLPTHRGHALPAAAIAALPTRSGSVKNPSYFALTPQSLTDFDWLAVFDTTVYSRGGPPLDGGNVNARQ
ncbi:MAG TPA: erythromycin esterase family protein [Ktedonobacterales bacterium]|nr:erythromycin esterase family protein [Ktedonobacterales bacterium]